MPHMLKKLADSYSKKTFDLVNRASEVQKKSQVNKWETRYLTEGLIHEAWQDWCLYCRTLLISSCKGCICVDGTKVLPRGSDNTWQRISYIFKHPKSTGTSIVKGMWNEPTWGDVTKLYDAVSALAMHNEAVLKAAFSQSNLNQSLIHLQKVRNCIAHTNAETVAAVKSLYVHYTVPQKTIAPHETIWLSNGPNIAFYTWLSDMRQIASLSVRSSP